MSVNFDWRNGFDLAYSFAVVSDQMLETMDLRMRANKTNSPALNAKVANFFKDSQSKLIDSRTPNRLVHVNRKGRGRFLNAEMLPPIEISAARRLIKNECVHVEKDELIRKIPSFSGSSVLVPIRND